MFGENAPASFTGKIDRLCMSTVEASYQRGCQWQHHQRGITNSSVSSAGLCDIQFWRSSDQPQERLAVGIWWRHDHITQQHASVGGTSAATTLDLNLGHANTWTATQTFPNGSITSAMIGTLAAGSNAWVQALPQR